MNLLWYVEVIVVPFLGGFGMSIAPYPPDVERRMKELYDSLNEKDRRRYAGVEAAKLGFGGRIYVARLLGCDEKTIRRGLQELDDPPDLPPDRIRKKGRT